MPNKMILGRIFDGTDHVFRLNGTRVEAFSGLEKGLLQLLRDGRVEAYRQEVYANRGTWPTEAQWAPDWNGLVSVQDDGTVLGIRRLRVSD